MHLLRCLYNYFCSAGIREDSNKFIFRHIIRRRSGLMLHKKRRLLYGRARDILLDRLEKMGLDRTRFGLHNLRSGGTSAASNASVCDRLIMKHGRWANEKSNNLYIHEKLETKLSVTKNMK